MKNFFRLKKNVSETGFKLTYQPSRTRFKLKVCYSVNRSIISYPIILNFRKNRVHIYSILWTIEK